ncbi:hypothetical protein HMPREF9134_01875 [Porphyromonas catoniae F0037]|uniref:Uncharacterized protein n=1 Tax=Porphyromonas catoniae F0037 TaxID=1127696 RepID=L1N9V2_9PORP|nr:hypothetical protein HMPREF9134_01875 [Porphyromonas catoniae F0037]
MHERGSSVVRCQGCKVYSRILVAIAISDYGGLVGRGVTYLS